MTSFSVGQLQCVANELLLAAVEKTVLAMRYHRDVAWYFVCQNWYTKRCGFQKTVCKAFCLRIIDNDIGLGHEACH